jgi:NAD(P)H-flavin reductase
MTRPAPPSLGPSPWTAHVMRIVAVRPEIEGVQTFDLEFRDGPPPGGYRFLPGQFNMLCLPGIGEAAISIASDPRAAAPVGHTFRAVGNLTTALARLGVGAEVILRGPFGTAWPLATLVGRDLVIAAGGLGLASLRAAILHVASTRDDYGQVAVLHGAKRPADLLYTSEYDAWRKAGLDVRVIVDAVDPAAAAAWTGPVGFVPALLDGLALAPGRTSLLCCGPEPMMHAVVERAVAVAGGAAADASSAAAGAAAETAAGPLDVWLSLERNMACAAGFCGLCQFGPEFVCRDGPVFRHDRIARFLAIRHL